MRRHSCVSALRAPPARHPCIWATSTGKPRTCPPPLPAARWSAVLAASPWSSPACALKLMFSLNTGVLLLRQLPDRWRLATEYQRLASRTPDLSLSVESRCLPAYISGDSRRCMKTRTGFRHRFSLRHSYRTFRSSNAAPRTPYLSERARAGHSEKYRVHGAALLLRKVL